MAAPVQIILNEAQFESIRDKGRGGTPKDFFAGKDKEFIQHKAEISNQLSRIVDALNSSKMGNIGILKIVLRRLAWAKSHRPFGELFKLSRTPLLGGDDLGEILVGVKPDALLDVRKKILDAEDKTNLVPNSKSGKLVPIPSFVRSETGAIERFELYGTKDRCKFSASDAIEWLSNPMTGGMYHIELFDIPRPRPEWDVVDKDQQVLYSTFIDGLQRLGKGLVAKRLSGHNQGHPIISLRLGESNRPPLLLFGQSSGNERPDEKIVPFDSDPARHARLIAFLASHPLTRRVTLPPLIVRNAINEDVAGSELSDNNRTRPMNINLPSPDAGRSYPKIGIIDGGVSNVLGNWIVDRWDYLDDEDKSLDHGTFIAGLTVVGSALNGTSVCPDTDGAHIYDISIFSDTHSGFEQYYQNDQENFFDEIRDAVAHTKSAHGTRIYNFSLNLIYQQANPNQYSYFAAVLDNIAEEHDVIFFISAGNTSVQDARQEWSHDAIQSLNSLAVARNDGILSPAESVRNISVAALNPPDHPICIARAPANYSRRGPGIRTGVKPDLAHFGGTGTHDPVFGSGLFSILPNGNVHHGYGTSYATPLVAKTAAALDHNIAGDVSRETLAALLIHHAQIPDPLASNAFSGVAKDLVGFGMPSSAQSILEGNDHQITLVFAHRLKKDQQISFPFSWPPSLVRPGSKCRGHVALTLVSSPPVNPKFGAEFIRINIDAALQQEVINKDYEPLSRWKGRLDPVYLPSRTKGPAIESARIQQGYKWSPTKVFRKNLQGVGESSNWRMLISYLERSGEVMPEEGVPFTAILTISDPSKEAAVFDDMRLQLTNSGVELSDIRMAAQITTRV